jgi:hypothetical protein
MILIRLRIWIGIKVEIRIRKSNFYRSPSSHYLIVPTTYGFRIWTFSLSCGVSNLDRIRIQLGLWIRIQVGKNDPQKKEV